MCRYIPQQDTAETNRERPCSTHALTTWRAHLLSGLDHPGFEELVLYTRQIDVADKGAFSPPSTVVERIYTHRSVVDSIHSWREGVVILLWVDRGPWHPLSFGYIEPYLKAELASFCARSNRFALHRGSNSRLDPRATRHCFSGCVTSRIRKIRILLTAEGAYRNLTNFAKSETSDLTNLAGLCTK